MNETAVQMLGYILVGSLLIFELWIRVSEYHSSPRRYPYFDVVVGLEWSHDPESYAGGSVNYW